MKILLTYDFIGTKSEIGKFMAQRFDFIAKILKSLNVEVCIDNSFYPLFSYKDFSKSIDSKLEKKYNKIDLSKLTEDAKALIINYVKDFDILITYELSPSSRKILDSLNIVYIDFWISPIRFHNDLLLSFYSNNDAIQNELIQFKINNTDLYNSISSIKEHFKFFKEDISLEKDSALIIGQMFEDKAVIDENGNFLNLTHFIPEIELLSTKFNKLYLSKHPLLSYEKFEIILNAFKHIENIEYLENNDINTYQLLTKKEIKCVIALSSSVLTEAYYFNKETIWLLKPILDSNYNNIYKEFFKSNFWAKILNIKTDLDIEYLADNNYLRILLSAYYSYLEFIPNKLSCGSVYTGTSKIYQLLQTLDQTKPYILYGYGSIGKLIEPHIRNIIGVIDKTLVQEKTIGTKEYKVLTMNELLEHQEAYVIITPYVHTEEIEKELRKYTKKIITFEF